MKIKAKSRKYLELWRNFTQGSINRQIFAATLTVGLFTGFVKFASVGKELVIAWRFGTGNDLDAYVMALVIPSFLINVVAGSFKSALIPEYIKVREQQGQAAAQQLFSGVIVWALGLLIVTTLAMTISAPLYLPWLASGFDPEKLQLTTRLLWAISPAIILAGLINIWEGVLNAGENFALAAASHTFLPLATIIMLLAFPSWQIYALAAGFVFGCLLQMTVLGIGLHRQKISVLPKWKKYDANLNQVAKQYFPVITGAFLMCSTNLVDQSMAAMLDSGSVAALSYATRVIFLPLTLATLALGTAVVPYFSKIVAQKNWSKIKHTFNYYLRLIFITTIPITIIFIVASKLIIQILFERGSFTAEDTYLVSQIQICYALQIPFYISAIFVVRLINSLGINHFLAWGSAINYLISFIFLYVLTRKYLNKISLENI